MEHAGYKSFCLFRSPYQACPWAKWPVLGTFHNRVNFCYRFSVWNDDSPATELKYTNLQRHSSLHFAAAAAAHMICGNWQSLNFHIVFQDSKLPRSELCSCNLNPQSVKTSCAVCKWLQDLMWMIKSSSQGSFEFSLLLESSQVSFISYFGGLCKASSLLSSRPWNS